MRYGLSRCFVVGVGSPELRVERSISGEAFEQVHSQAGSLLGFALIAHHSALNAQLHAPAQADLR